MIKRIFFYTMILAGLAACSDDDSFTTDSSARLTMATDTIKMDTVFSGIGTRTYDFWVYNHAGDGIRLSSVRLAQGNQTGFRVNVDGSYLDNSLGAVVNDLEVRKDDSIRVFVELTAPRNGKFEPQLVEDQIVFRLESGVEQRVVLRGHAWDAVEMRNVVIDSDSVIESRQPVIVYGGLQVNKGATLTIKNTTLFFHDGKGIDVYGRLMTDSVTMRGDRLDHMFDYLPYDRVSGQWGKNGGVIFHESSTGNILKNTEIRNAGDFGVVCDSAGIDENVLRLDMLRCVIHNSKGTGLSCTNANIRARECQFSNAQGDCIYINGGKALISRCTLAQFYIFAGGHGAALNIENGTPLIDFLCDSSIVTGYDKDVFTGVIDSTVLHNYHFSHTLLRTPRVETGDSVNYTNVIWETPSDTIQGAQHFILVDDKNLKYDFHLDSKSPAARLGCYPLQNSENVRGMR